MRRVLKLLFALMLPLLPTVSSGGDYDQLVDDPQNMEECIQVVARFGSEAMWFRPFIPELSPDPYLSSLDLLDDFESYEAEQLAENFRIVIEQAMLLRICQLKFGDEQSN